MGILLLTLVNGEVNYSKMNMAKVICEQKYKIVKSPSTLVYRCLLCVSCCTIAKTLEVVAEIFPLEGTEVFLRGLIKSLLSVDCKSHGRRLCRFVDEGLIEIHHTAISFRLKSLAHLSVQELKLF